MSSTIAHTKESSTTTEPRWLNDRQQHVWRQWLRAHNELNAAISRQLHRDAALSDPDYAVLVTLSEAPDGQIRATGLADAMLWERSRLSHQVRRMEARGLVQRVECEQDRRGAWVSITDAGRAALEAAAPGHVETVRAHLIDLLDDDMLDALDRITASILASTDCPSRTAAD